MKMLGIVAVGVVRESRKFSGHPCKAHCAVIFAIAQLSCSFQFFLANFEFVFVRQTTHRLIMSNFFKNRGSQAAQKVLEFFPHISWPESAGKGFVLGKS